MQILLRGGVYWTHFFIKPTCSFTGVPLITIVFTQRYLYTEKPLHRNAFLHTGLSQREDEQFDTQIPKQTGLLVKGMHLRLGFFPHRHTGAWFSTVGTCMAQRVPPAYANAQFQHRLWRSRRISWERVSPAQTHIAIWPLYHDRHLVRDGCVSWASIHDAALPLEEKKLKHSRVKVLRLYIYHFTKLSDKLVELLEVAWEGLNVVGSC